MVDRQPAASRSCARRAGHVLADRGLAETVLVFGQRTNGGRESRSLVLIRPGSAVAGDPNALLRAALGQPVGPRLRESQRIWQARFIRGAVADADAAAISARTADMAVIDPREARQLADQLGTVIADLGRLRRRLDTRAKSGP